MSSDRDPSPLARLPLWASPLLFGALYLVAVALGLQLQISRPSVAAFWPASGLALAALLLLLTILVLVERSRESGQPLLPPTGSMQ